MKVEIEKSSTELIAALANLDLDEFTWHFSLIFLLFFVLFVLINDRKQHTLFFCFFFSLLSLSYS